MARSLFTVSLQVNNDTFTEKAPTIEEALQKLNRRGVKTRGIFTIKKGKKQSEMAMYPIPIKRLFANKTAQQIFAKRMLTLMR